MSTQHVGPDRLPPILLLLPRAVPLGQEPFIDLLVDPKHPALRLRSALLEVFDLRLECGGAILGLAQLERELVRQLERAIAIHLRRPRLRGDVSADVEIGRAALLALSP